MVHRIGGLAPALALLLAACGAAAPEQAGAGPAPSAPAPLAASAAGFACTVASITDGDTLRCEEREADGRQIRVRLSGVAARERDGTCTPGHPCPEASAEAATGALAALANGRRLSCEEVGRTHGRRAALCRREDGVDLSCAMVRSGTALRWERYWRGPLCEPGAAT